MVYDIQYSKEAREHFTEFEKSGNTSLLRKVAVLLKELEEHPYTGTGKPEKLKGNLSGHWSRRITKEHRLVYAVNEKIVTVVVVSAKGHYD